MTLTNSDYVAIYGGTGMVRAGGHDFRGRAFDFGEEERVDPMIDTTIPLPEKHDVGRRLVIYWEAPDHITVKDAVDVDWRFHVADLTHARMEKV